MPTPSTLVTPSPFLEAAAQHPPPIEPPAPFPSNGEPFAWQAAQAETQTTAQLQARPQGTVLRPIQHGYAIQTQPWALRFRDPQFEDTFQIRRAAGECEASCPMSAARPALLLTGLQSAHAVQFAWQSQPL